MKYFLIICLSITLIACKCSKENKEVIRSFCYWKTAMNFDLKEDSLVNEINIKHFYVRYFDVDYNLNLKKALPLASIRDLYFGKTNVQFTPSVFITNDVVLKSSKTQLDTLANQICKRVNRISDNYFTHVATAYANEIASADYEKQKGDTKIYMDSEPIIAKRKLEMQKNIQDILID